MVRQSTAWLQENRLVFDPRYRSKYEYESESQNVETVARISPPWCDLGRSPSQEKECEQKPGVRARVAKPARLQTDRLPHTPSVEDAGLAPCGGFIAAKTKKLTWIVQFLFLRFLAAFSLFAPKIDHHGAS